MRKAASIPRPSKPWSATSRRFPTLPNPQDSYAEILRMSGNFDAALEHYRAALKIDPEFDYSQLGLGDTYALMGNQAQARVEYDKAIQKAHTEADRLSYALQKRHHLGARKQFCRSRQSLCRGCRKSPRRRRST